MLTCYTPTTKVGAYIAVTSVRRSVHNWACKHSTAKSFSPIFFKLAQVVLYHPRRNPIDFGRNRKIFKGMFTHFTEVHISKNLYEVVNTLQGQNFSPIFFKLTEVVFGHLRRNPIDFGLGRTIFKDLKGCLHFFYKNASVQNFYELVNTLQGRVSSQIFFKLTQVVSYHLRRNPIDFGPDRTIFKGMFTLFHKNAYVQNFYELVNTLQGRVLHRFFSNSHKLFSII